LVGPGVGQKREASFKEDVKQYRIDGMGSRIFLEYMFDNFLPSFQILKR